MTTTNDTPINSDALSARLRAHGAASPSLTFALVCDMLTAYAAAWNAEPPVAETYCAEHGTPIA